MTQSNNAASTPKDNVLHFPKSEGFLGNSPTDVNKTLEDNVQIWIDAILPTICSATFNEMSKIGIGLFDPAIVYDMIMVQEACRSLMLSSLKLSHPFQNIAREVLEMDEWGGINIYSTEFVPDEESGLEDDPMGPDKNDPGL